MTEIRYIGWKGPDGYDTLDRLKQRLREHTLDPRLAPFIYEREESNEHPERVGYAFRGNFFDLSAVFNIWTDEVHEIAELVALIERNTASADYHRAARDIAESREWWERRRQERREQARRWAGRL